MRTFLYIISILLCMNPVGVWAQTNESRAHDLASTAIDKMEQGEYKTSLQLLKTAKQLDPDRIDYPYEIAYAHYLNHRHKKAIKILLSLKDHPQVNDRVFQLLGNNYVMTGRQDKAIATYEEGLQRFPRSGLLYMERGVMELRKEAFAEALSYFEKGIYLEPSFPSNYYWACKIYCSSTEEVWGMLYGELFLNLERNGPRTQEISKLLFDVYQREITFGSDSSFSVSFSQQSRINIEDLTSPENFRRPFGIGVYEPLILTSLLKEASINLESLSRIRTNFLISFFEKEHQKTYPNVLLEWQKYIRDNGHFEAYNYWLLMKGAEPEFDDWLKANQKQYESFILWFASNKLRLNEENNFHSSQY